MIAALKYNTHVFPEVKQVVELATFLCDLKDEKQVHAVLNELEIHPHRAKDVVRMIDLVSSPNNGDSTPDNELELYPRYAHRLEAIGEIGILRCYLYYKQINRPLFTESTPRPTTLEELYGVATRDRFDNYVEKSGSSSFIDHFYDKLLHLREFGTNPHFTQEATKRRAVMEEFVLEFGRSGRIDELYILSLAEKYKMVAKNLDLL